MVQFKVRVTSTRPNTSIRFYKDIDVINYVLNEYVVTQQLRATTTFSDDELVQTTILEFNTVDDFKKVQADPIMQEHNRKRHEYNQKNNIQYLSEKIYE